MACSLVNPKLITMTILSSLTGGPAEVLDCGFGGSNGAAKSAQMQSVKNDGTQRIMLDHE